MGYETYLKDLLRPMRLYELDEGYGALELQALGGFMDELCADSDHAGRESILATAEDTGLDGWGSILAFYPASGSVEEVRAALAALIRIDGGSFTESALNATIRGIGVSAAVKESAIPQTVEVSFPGVKGVPDDFATIQARVELIIPCHLNIVYVFKVFTWADLEAGFKSWAALETVGTWAGLEGQ